MHSIYGGIVFRQLAHKTKASNTGAKVEQAIFEFGYNNAYDQRSTPIGPGPTTLPRRRPEFTHD